MSDEMSDDHVAKIQSEVTAAHARMDAFAERIGGIEVTQRGMAQDIKTLLGREPSKMPVFALGGVLAVILTILSLVVAPIYGQLSRNSAKLENHADGHPEWVAKVMALEFVAIRKELSSLDKIHSMSEASLKEEVAELRGQNKTVEDRQLGQDKRIERLETQMEERTKDRWTGEQDAAYRHSHEWLHAAEKERWLAQEQQKDVR